MPQITENQYLDNTANRSHCKKMVKKANDFAIKNSKGKKN